MLKTDNSFDFTAIECSGLGRDQTFVYYKSLSVQIPLYLNLFFPLFNIELLWVSRPIQMQFLQILIAWTLLVIKSIPKPYSQNLEPNSYYHLDTRLLPEMLRKFSWQKIVLNIYNCPQFKWCPNTGQFIMVCL